MPTYITLVCGNCNNSFEFENKPGRKPSYCSKKCKDDQIKLSIERSRERAPDKNCKRCGKVFKALPRSGENRNLFCSRECVELYAKEQGKHLESKCLYCGEIRRLASNRLFCNIKCKTNYILLNPIYCDVKKKCNSCGESKSLYEFSLISINESMNFSNFCVKCKSRKSNAKRTKEDARQNHLMSRYGITQELFDKIIEEQNGICPICERSQEEWKDEGRKGAAGQWHIDHDHETGKIRGCLCYSCNIGLGKFSDNPNILIKAIEYLEKHGKKLE